MLFIAVRGIYLYKKNKSTLDLYFGMVGVFFSLCFIAYGFPPLTIRCFVFYVACSRKADLAKK